MGNPTDRLTPEAMQAAIESVEAFSPFAADQRIRDLEQENYALKVRLSTLIDLAQLGAGADLQQIAALAKRYLPAEHHDAVVYLLRLAHARGYLDSSALNCSPRFVIERPKEGT